MDEDGLEHVRQHVLDLVRVLLQLFASGHQRLQAVRRPLVAALLLLGVVLTLGVLQVDGDGQSDVDQGRHQLHRGQSRSMAEGSDLRKKETFKNDTKIFTNTTTTVQHVKFEI